MMIFKYKYIIFLLYLVIFPHFCFAQANSSFEWTGKTKDGAIITMEMIIDYLELHEQWLKDNNTGKRFELAGADLSGIDLSETNLEKANLENANLSRAHLSRANLSEANLMEANLKEAALNSTNLSKADLFRADLSNAGISWANLSKAFLADANLSGARIDLSNMSEIYLSEANLENVNLSKSTITGAKFGNINLKSVLYESVIGAPDSNSIGEITGLETLRYNTRNGVAGLVLLRNILKTSGLREAEREVTYAIEHGRLPFLSLPDRIFRFLFFELTCEYGYKYWRPFQILGCLYVLFSLIYFFTLFGSPESHRIYKIWNKERLESQDGSDEPQPIKGTWYKLILPACYFSLLSATRIGWREFNFGSWIINIQRHDYTLKPTGWVRTISGTQSLLSVYFLALWALTYFGRPFE